MKAILEFSMPDDESQFRAAVGAPDLVQALIEAKQIIRLQLKHGNPEDDRTQLERLRELIYDALLGIAE